MKISEIYIKGLYGSYTYHIEGIDRQNLLVLTGYNGMGKTTLLNIVKNVAESNLWFFYELDFEELNVSFEDGLSLQMKSEREASPSMTGNAEASDENVSPEKCLSYGWYKDSVLISGVKVNRHSFYKAYTVVFKKDYVSEESNWEREMRLKMREIVAFICKKQNAMSFEMLQSSIKAFLIPAQRVKQIRPIAVDDDLYLNSMEEIDTIDLVAESFGKLLDQKRIEFLSSIQNSKNHLIDRLLTADTQVLSEDEYRDTAQDAQTKIDDLSQFGIVYEKVRPYSAENARLLSAYLLELKDTLDRYIGLLHDLKLFASILKEKHMLHKTISFSPSYGFKLFNDQGVSITLSKLSSGEQNMIILLYRMIFEVKDGDIVLIDEPEISMHVVWLKEFIRDIVNIANSKKDVQILIATHSPQIVRGAGENCFDLEMSNHG